MTFHEVAAKKQAARWLLVAALSAWLIGGCSTGQADRQSGTPAPLPAVRVAAEAPVTPDTALALLQAGNARFVAGQFAAKDLSAERRQTLLQGQHPFAIVVACADSRVPPELIFDQGLGDLFVVRVAGNVVDPVVLGSVEYAAEHLHAPLVVVLGHEQCGAVQAAVADGHVPGSVGAIVEKITPSVDRARAQNKTGPALLALAITLNVQTTADALRASPIVAHLQQEGHLRVVGAVYSLDSGRVEWLQP